MTMKKIKYIHPETEVVYMQSAHLLAGSDPTNPSGPNAGGGGNDGGDTSHGEDPNEQGAKQNPFGWQSVGWDDGIASQQNM